MNYESETEDGSTGLDDVVWPKVFEKYEQFLRDVRVQPGDDRLELNPHCQAFLCAADRHDPHHCRHSGCNA
mgnify:CR=1 FL=1